jgi:hypothetical protein
MLNFNKFSERVSCRYRAQKSQEKNNRTCMRLSLSNRSPRGTAVAAIISWAGTDDRGDLSPPPAARGRPAPDAAATALFFGRWRPLKHLQDLGSTDFPPPPPPRFFSPYDRKDGYHPPPPHPLRWWVVGVEGVRVAAGDPPTSHRLPPTSKPSRWMRCDNEANPVIRSNPLARQTSAGDNWHPCAAPS